MKEKLLFFDIDGTLVNFKGQMPESARAALKEAQKNGHKIFLCTGRGKGQIYPFLLDFGFDGVVAAAGAYVEYHGKILIHKVYGADLVRTVSELFAENDTSFMLQTTAGCVMTHRGLVRFVRSLGVDAEDEDAARAFVKKTWGTLILDDDAASFAEKYADTENLLYSDCPLSIAEVQKAVGPGLLVVPPSFSHVVEGQGEITISGVEKSAAIRETAEKIGKSIGDTVAFGDGPNDVEMLRAAGIGVAMGNAIPEAREAADVVTRDIDDGGIAYALRELGLI